MAGSNDSMIGNIIMVVVVDQNTSIWSLSVARRSSSTVRRARKAMKHPPAL